MNNQVLKLVALGIGVVLIAALLSTSAVAEQKGNGDEHPKAETDHPKAEADHPKAEAAPAKIGRCSKKREMCKKKVSQVIEAVDNAAKAVEAGDKAKALAELAKAKELLLACQKAMSAKGKIVNALCPIMGTKLDPSKVPAGLTRAYNGAKVGFCCGGCPAAWDKLTDQQRQEKLAKAGVSKPKTCKPAKSDKSCGPDKSSH